MTFTDTSTDLVALVRSGPVLVTGAGVSGEGAIKILRDLGCPEIHLVDDSAERGRPLADSHGVDWCTADAARGLLSDAAAVVTSPGWRPDTPLLVDAADAGVPVVGDVAVAFAGDRAGTWGDPRTWLVVTGTNGKTTTTAMLAAMLGDRGAAVGNIGVALHDALTAADRVDVLAAELSSFQLHWAPELRPDAGALLNLAEDHIDWHGSYDAYGADKAIALTGGVAVFGADDADVVKQVEALAADGRLAPAAVGFTIGEPEPGQIGVRDGRIIDRAFGDRSTDEPHEDTAVGGVDVAPIEGISPPGPAGVLDALAATALARSVGVRAADIAEALAGFTVRAHRGQVVHSAGGVDWIDDSKATNPHAADAALRGHDSVVWVAGGQLKGADVSGLVADHAHRMRAAVVLGVDGPVIAEALASAVPGLPVTVIGETDPAAAMGQACSAAAGAARPGDVVLLAPAAASLDMFTGMAQRGDFFADAAREATAPGTEPGTDESIGPSGPLEGDPR
ncbi:UDP-N-acetylmuramoyl-L-alanine--D-glutamate ligase [Corynebacterium hansenii]|uniref:UDP-N-acetylmuramoylalanine--D-glutamate ligase n=1 Tax=Corynebacterium hansenii TaxID=394964 RepID=A0ABV7ZNE8_9CORY|nr:UDP-N-acetylmuramoyl-L-alanine--D-glutamate ligase [Corynebacterium hansenii]WJZ00282.1 UDP-N-acetylmuramoylalanine--D-glutamate ligase [Corynebacterium hansenii]